MKNIFTLLILLLSSINCLGAEPEEVLTILTNNLSVAKSELSLLKVKQKSYPETSYVPEISFKEEQIKTLKEEIKITKNAIKTKEKLAKAEKVVLELKNSYSTLFCQTNAIYIKEKK